MLRLSIGLIVVAIIAAIFGFGGIAAGAAYAAKIVFFIAVALLVLSLIFGGFRKK
ncbi:DUF1328 family protein [Brumimicrobium aurantiacum]|uniref:DUF1328 domain-containing protein n=1 Tax=Brumimicrobium aurantiacum TaxID=1737063 RepID=A0A3E1EZI6_9FLAO|nr:DUF1328 family protein [Brumimicrobium aurantiacum]RFC54893.1 DUF1328 domain-containing protein [Brumimicrobium aurantiacum]